MGWEQDGFAILPAVFGPVVIERLTRALAAIDHGDSVRSRGGVFAVRNLLGVSAGVAEFARSAEVVGMVERHLGTPAFPVQGTLFDKTAGANWLVPWHQDLTISVAERRDVAGYGPWSRKAGIWHVQPPTRILEGMLSVRIHLDDCEAANGALRVMPGTHLAGRLTEEAAGELQKTGRAVTCAVGAGGVVLMRPLLLHASSAAAKAAHRRVIHIDYGSAELDGGLDWYVRHPAPQ